MKECLFDAPSGTKLRMIEHPGFIYDGVIHCTFPNKYAIVSSDGAFYGNVPRFLNIEEKSRTSCLTAFTLVEAKKFLKTQLECQ